MVTSPLNACHVRVAIDRTTELMKALEELTRNSVFVGIPSTKAGRDPVEGQTSGPNNAVIGYVMENGDPGHNVPARPFLVPAIRVNQPTIVALLKDIAKAAMLADVAKMRNLRVQLGLFTQRAVQQKITDGPFEPLAEATLEARARRKFGKGAAGARKGALLELQRRSQGLPAGTDLARPLIDTGQLRRAVSYVIGPTRHRAKTIQAMTGNWYKTTTS